MGHRGLIEVVIDEGMIIAPTNFLQIDWSSILVKFCKVQPWFQLWKAKMHLAVWIPNRKLTHKSNFVQDFLIREASEGSFDHISYTRGFPPFYDILALLYHLC